MAKKKKDTAAATLTPSQVREITEYINKRKTEGAEPKTIRKEVFKKFNIDTEQWQLNWANNATTVKGSNRNMPVDAAKALATTNNIVRRKEPTSFRYEFSEAEINDRAKMVAQLELDREALEADKKNIMNDFKTKIEEKETQINKLAREINSGSEMRNEVCIVIRDFEKGTKTVTYKDKVVKEEKLTNADYTLLFPEEQEELS